jgi:hypothetical protein
MNHNKLHPLLRRIPKDERSKVLISLRGSNCDLWSCMGIDTPILCSITYSSVKDQLPNKQRLLIDKINSSTKWVLVIPVVWYLYPCMSASGRGFGLPTLHFFHMSSLLQFVSLSI